MATPEEHLDNLIRHIDLVRNACVLLGKRLIAQGQEDFGRMLIGRGFVHDSSKFYGIEWDHLHNPDATKTGVKQAIRQHVHTNSHHPEYWGGIDNMPKLAVAEMVADWYARAQEFGSDLREWIKDDAVPRYKIKKTSEQYKWITSFVDILLESSFVSMPKDDKP